MNSIPLKNEQSSEPPGEDATAAPENSGELQKSINVQDNRKWNAFSSAVKHNDWDIADFLLKRGMDTSEIAAGELKDVADKLNFFAFKGYFELFKLSVDNGGIIDKINIAEFQKYNKHKRAITDESNLHVLHLAALGGNLKIFIFILETSECFDFNIQVSDGYTLLNLAARNGNHNICKYLVDKGAVKKVKSALYEAVRSENLDTVEYFISVGANLNVVNQTGDSPMHFAARNKNNEILKYFLNIGGKTNVANKRGQIALHCAADCGNLEAVKYLIAVGEDLNVGDQDGDTAMHFAARNGDNEIIKYLISNGGNAKVANKQGETALHHCTEQLDCDLETVEDLISAGANLNAVDQNGDSPIHFAARNGANEILKYLLSNGGNANVANKQGETALHQCTEQLDCDLDTVEYLISAGADLNAVDQNGDTPIHFAARNKDKDILKYLLYNGGNAKVVKKQGDTALHTCIKYRNCDLETLNYFIFAGADLSAVDHNGDTPIHFAARNGDNAILIFLIRICVSVTVANKRGETPLHKCTEQLDCDLDTVEYLITAGADLNAVDQNGDTPIHFAARNKDKDILKFLLNSGGNAKVANKQGETALHTCIKYRNCDVETVNRFIFADADLSAVDHNGDTPIHFAARNGDNASLLYLIRTCESATVANKRGQIALHYAAEYSVLEAVIRLILDDSNMNAADEDGNTVMHFAARNISDEILNYLLLNGGNINISNKQLKTPLHCAVTNSENVKYLVSQGAYIDKTDIHDDTAAHIAAREGYIKTFDYLVSKGANTAIVNIFGENVLHCAVKGLSHHIASIKQLFENIDYIELADVKGNTALQTAARLGFVDIFNWLLTKGASTKVVNYSGDTLLHSAIYGVSQSIIETVANNINTNSRNYYGVTPLDVAAQIGNVDIFILLLDKGLEIKDFDKIVMISALCGNLEIVHYCMDNYKKYNLNVAPQLYEILKPRSIEIVKHYSATIINTNVMAINNQSPLHISIKAKNLEVTKYLIENEINIEATDSDGCTALHLAASNVDLDTVKYLVTNGSNLNATDDLKQTPLHIAICKYSYSIVKYLIMKKADYTIKNCNGFTAKQLALSNDRTGEFHYMFPSF